MVKRGVGSIKIFRRKFFVSECRKLSSSNLSVLQNFFFYRKVSGKREGAGIKIFVKIFLSLCRKLSYRNPSVFNKVSGIEKFYG